MKSGDTKPAASKSAAARATAQRTAAAKAAASRAAATKTAAKTTAARTNAAKTAAAKAAAAKTAAAKAAAADAAAAAESAEKATSALVPAPEEDVADTASRKPASKRPTAKRATPAKKATPAKPRAMREAAPTKRTPRLKAEVAADDAAPVSEAVSSPTTTVQPTAADAVAEDALFAEILGAEPQVAEAAVVEQAAVKPETIDAVVPETIEPEPAAAVEPAEAEPAEAEAEETDAVAAVVDQTIESTASATNAVVLRGLVKDFGDQRAVNGIDLTIPAGSFYGIVGPNGAGKTTTLSILAGLLRATSGQVVVCGIDQASDALAAKRVMGVLPDRLRTFDRLTGRQLLHYYGLLRGLSSEVIDKRTADLARAFDLSDALSRVVSDYSAGMTKKIMLAGAMIHSPRVLVLDEPFEAVDPVSSAVILDILRAYVAHGGTVILSSHGMDLVERVCSRVAIIVGGDVLAEGTIDEVRAGQTLEARFVELSGGVGEVEGLEWLHTFSD